MRGYRDATPQIKFEKGAFFVNDLRSSNGTYVNDQRIYDALPLRSGDVIRIGPYRFSALLDTSDGSTRPVELPAGEDDRTVQAPAARRTKREIGKGVLRVRMGDELFELDIKDAFDLSDALTFGKTHVPGTAGRIVKRTAGYFLEPVTGRDSVFHNGRRATQTTELSDGDRIEVGPITLEFERL